MTGELRILNVGDGDTKLSFDPSNPAEVERTRRIITDMIRRGYVLLVDIGGGTYQRALSFDAEKNEYVIADFDPTVAAKVDQEDTAKPTSREDDAREPEGETPSETAGAAPALICILMPPGLLLRSSFMILSSVHPTYAE